MFLTLILQLHLKELHEETSVQQLAGRFTELVNVTAVKCSLLSIF